MENNIKRKRRKNNIKLNFLLVLAIIAVLLNGFGIYYCKNLYELQKEENNINEGYKKDDIKSIEEVRKFYLCYFAIEEYEIDALLWEGGYGKYNNIIDESRRLLKKFDEIKLDENKTLVYDEVKRNIKIVQEAFTLSTEFNVDLKSSYKYHFNILETIKTGRGTWAKVDRGIPKYVLYLFGNPIDEIEINNISGLLRMLDLNEITEGQSYKINTKYYLFRDEMGKEYEDYYIYIIEENEWLKFNSIKEIEVTDEFISFIDSDNNFYVYCDEHDSKIFVSKLQEDEELEEYYLSNIFMPKSIAKDEELKQKIFNNHEECK